MLIVLIVISLIGVFYGAYEREENVTIGSAILAVLSIIAGCIILGCVINGRTLEDKITLYEAENAAIEEDINILVEQYMKYEADTYESLKGESGITLVSLYPELKADTLVSQQCDLYISNKEQIARLKEEQINLSSYRFWLYFGK